MRTYRSPVWVVEKGKIPPPLTRLPPFDKGGVGGIFQLTVDSLPRWSMEPDGAWLGSYNLLRNLP